MSKICVYAICKNELKFVEKWLENMSEADYIVVLDTGSTDGTYEALTQDSRVTRVEQEIITPWRFDVARNRSMDLIPDDADILVCTDFDELFEPGWAQFLRDNWVPGYHNRCHYPYAWGHGEIGEAQYVFAYDKIHTKQLYWKYPVHEILAPRDNEYEDVILTGGESIFLHHWQDTSKPRGNYLDLLLLSAEENPGDGHVLSLLGREYVIKGDFQKAIDVFLKTLVLPDIDEIDCGLILLQTLHLIAFSYYSLQNYDEALWYCQEFIRTDPTYREPYFLMGRVYIDLHLNTLAEAVIQAGLKHSTYKCNWVESGSSWSSESEFLLGAIYLNLKNYEQAEIHLKEALRYQPENVQLLKQYITALEEQKKN